MAKIPKVVLLIENSRTYGRELLRGIARYNRFYGPWSFYMEPPFYLESGGRIRQLDVSHLKQLEADGIIMRDTEKPEEIARMGIPTIIASAIKGPMPGIPTICTNDARIGKMAAEHLLERGLRHFGYCGFDDMSWSQKRRDSFVKSVAKAKLEVSVYQQPKSRAARVWESEQSIVAEWLKSLPKPVGLMVCNDDRGRQIIETCNAEGLKVPDEVAVIGVDNDNLVCELSNPPLSSIALNVERAGYEAAELLSKLMRGREKMAGQEIRVEPVHIVTRQSTDMLAIEDPVVSAALKFIRQHAKENIFVADVVEGVPTSRRGLQGRFLKVLHRSVQDEIARVRAEMVAQLLVETNLSISEICARLNYGGPEHISRSFKRAKGVSPRVFRRRYGHK
jgi:LacI family transcriptional regulator